VSHELEGQCKICSASAQTKGNQTLQNAYQMNQATAALHDRMTVVQQSEGSPFNELQGSSGAMGAQGKRRRKEEGAKQSNANVCLEIFQPVSCI
jgi:hypothetical protein